MNVPIDYETLAVLIDAASNWGDFLDDSTEDREEDLLPLDAALLLAARAKADAWTALVKELVA